MSNIEKSQRVVLLEIPIYIVATSTIVGKKEGLGQFAKYFENVVEDDTMKQDSYEKAERRFMERAIFGAIENAGKKEKDIDFLIGGDLLNQIVTSSYAARMYDIPFVGIYGACSTMAESFAVASLMLNGGFGKNAVCMTSSHFASSERQFRTPLELGCQRQPYAQWTVTGSGAAMLSKEGNGPKITKVCFGKVTDYGVCDIANMGAAMAPAAYETLVAFFKETKTGPKDYDQIITGDLGKLGSDILRDLMLEDGYDLSQKHADCGHMIYPADEKTFQGGSGAGCSAVIFNSYFYQKLKKKVFNKVLFVATGALMSPTTNQQGDTIPTIAHLIQVES